MPGGLIKLALGLRAVFPEGSIFLNLIVIYGRKILFFRKTFHEVIAYQQTAVSESLQDNPQSA
jgi:hypothetical protein